MPNLVRRELNRSLQSPHPESAQLAEQGREGWSRGLPEEDAEALVDVNARQCRQALYGSPHTGTIGPE